MAKINDQLLAYKISCGDGDHGSTVVFAVRASKVNKLHDTETCDCEFIERKVHRAKAFDKYAPGPVTTAQYLAEGWYWPCHDCGDLRYEDHSPIITDDGAVYCDLDCVLHHLKKCKEFGHESWRRSEAAIDLYLQTLQTA